MSQFSNTDQPSRQRRRRWLMLLAPTLLGLLLLLSVFLTLDAASKEEESDEFSKRPGLALAPVEAPLSQQTEAEEGGRYERLHRSADARHTMGVAWGDVDGDGDLDLAVGNGSFRAGGSYNQVNQIYYYNARTQSFDEFDIAMDAFETRAVAWGDMDGDGDLDLVVGNYGERNQIYENVAGVVALDKDAATPRGWQSADSAATTSLALGDYDGDGDLDLAVGNEGQANQLFRNISGTLRLRWPGLPLSDTMQTRAVAWGDMDGDQDLDLLVADYDGVDKIYENVQGELSLDPANDVGWESENPADLAVANEPCNAATAGGFVDPNFATRTRAAAWGDWDNDGDLDLATGGGSDLSNQCGAFLRVYENVEGQLRLNLNRGWQWSDKKSIDKPSSLEWGDWDGDGDLDLVVGMNAGGGIGRKNRVYENVGRSLVYDPVRDIGWQSTERGGWDSESTYSIAFGDADGDGDLDLAVGNGGARNGGQKNLILKNAEPAIAFSANTWTSADAKKSTSLAWGDWDGDGDLDLAVGNMGQANQVYENVDGVLNFDLQNGLGWESTILTADLTSSVAWADWDDDADLDLAVGNLGQPDVVYENLGTTLSLSVASGIGWVSPVVSDTQSLAWGDWDRDNDLDLVAAHCGADENGAVPQAAIVYENVDNTLSVDLSGVSQVGWVSPESICANSAAWGDWDDDADLDLALGARVYENIAGSLIYNERTRTGWDGGMEATSVAWGDYDGDGDIDLAVGTNVENRVFENIGGDLFFSERDGIGWDSGEVLQTTDVAWADVDGDEDLDLVVTNAADSYWFQPNQVFENVDQQLGSGAAWKSARSGIAPDRFMKSHAAAWGDVDRDGDLDLAVANYCDGRGCDSGERPNQVYINELQGRKALVGSSLHLTIEEPYQGSSADFYASPQILSTEAITVPFILRDENEVPVGHIEVYFSVDGGDFWQPAVLTRTRTTNLATSVAGSRHELVWDTFASKFFGKSDNVVLRMKAFDTPQDDQVEVSGTYRYHNGLAGSFQRPSVTAVSLPFRVQSTQIRVVDADDENKGVPGAEVFRLPAGQTAGAQLMPSPDNPLFTDSQGYLPGVGELERGDRLLAVRPADPSQQVTFTNKTRLYFTSGRPTENGLAMYNFKDPGDIALAISEDNPLLLFDIDMVLEWDARNDELFRTELSDGIKRASELLYDVTDGQAALGQVNVWQSKELWPYADVVVLANNAMRPTAAIGGVTQVPLAETVFVNRPDTTAAADLTETKVISDAYQKNQIRMGTVWDPFGENTSDLGPNWWQALAHEFAHYLFFLPDNYLGFKDDNTLGKINCQGSFMTSTFDPEYSEFLTEEGWRDICQESLAERTTGRTDWETVSKFYPILQGPQVPVTETGIIGPSNLPLEVTKVNFIEPNEERQTLRTRNFEVRREDNNERWRLPAAQAYLFQQQDNSDPTDDVLIQLGTPTGGGDRLKVRGAYPGDRLCLFDRSGEQAYAGCDNRLSSADVSIAVTEADNAWSPQIAITPVTSRTMQISVTQRIDDGKPVNVQLFPMHYWSKKDYVGLSPTAVMTSDGDLHTQTLVFRLPAYEVAARVWVDGDPGRETIDMFTLNPPWPETSGSSSSSVAGPSQSGIGGPSQSGIGGPSQSGIGGPSQSGIGGPSQSGIGGPSQSGIGGPSQSGIGGPSQSGIGGPSQSGIGGPSQSGIGGPSQSGIGGPSQSGIGGPSQSGIGGPSQSGIGGPSQIGIGGAPILSADAQVVVYSKLGFFEDNGVEALQTLSVVPALDRHEWLLPVGQAYHVTQDPSVQDGRIIALTYLQRDVPEGFEHTLAAYFLPDSDSADDERVWQRLPNSRQFVENLVVADLQEQDGTYAVMSSIEMPGMKSTGNLFSYPLAVSQTVTNALRSIAGKYENVVMAPGEPDAYEPAEFFEFGRAYWVDITAGETVTPYLAPPVRLPDGSLGFR